METVLWILLGMALNAIAVYTATCLRHDDPVRRQRIIDEHRRASRGGVR